jgi:hypothetical protein
MPALLIEDINITGLRNRNLKTALGLMILLLLCYNNSITMPFPQFPNHPLYFSDQGAKLLLEPVTASEVLAAAKSMKPYKTPWPDGSLTILFRAGSCPSNLTETFLSLIPKEDVPACKKQFRPVSLCDVSYKILTEVLEEPIRILTMPFLGLEFILVLHEYVY